MRRTSLLAGALSVAMLQFGCTSMMPRDAPTKQNHACPRNATCQVRVYPSVGPNQECKVWPEFEDLIVAPGQTPKMRWQIKPGPHDRYDYEFVIGPPVNGVKIIGNTAEDFDSPGYDTNWHGGRDKKTFKWENRHLRPRPGMPPIAFPYELFIQRRLHGAPSTDPWLPCPMVDPTIINK